MEELELFDWVAPKDPLAYILFIAADFESFLPIEDNPKIFSIVASREKCV